MSEVTLILNAIERGDDRAVDKLLPVVYKELRQLAAQKLSRERPGHTLQATALVHEAYIKLAASERQSWNSRTNFFGAAAEAMRRILIENARRKQSHKRGSGQKRVKFNEQYLAIEGPNTDLIALDEALTELEKVDETKAELVKLCYFAGLTLEQAAQALDVSHTTAKRHWKYARAWLFGRIRPKE